MPKTREATSGSLTWVQHGIPLHGVTEDNFINWVFMMVRATFIHEVHHFFHVDGQEFFDAHSNRPKGSFADNRTLFDVGLPVYRELQNGQPWLNFRSNIKNT